MATPSDLAVVLGAGPVGRALVDRLVHDGQPVRVVTRSVLPSSIPAVETADANMSDPDQAIRACAGAGVVYGCVGMGYGDWPNRWPPLMGGMLTGAQAAGARFVFTDNCYMYGPVDGAMTEDLPLTDYGRKPSTRSQITRMWQHAHEKGRLEAAAVRASDFYGPGVRTAALGERSVARLAAGKSAQMLGDPDQLHSFTYVPDIARALTSVGRAEDAMGQAWNVPNAPDRTVREVLEMFASRFGQHLKIQTPPKPLLSVMSIFSSDMRELKEMQYQWERPFRVDWSKFASRFWSDATPFDDGIAATAASYTV